MKRKILIFSLVFFAVGQTFAQPQSFNLTLKDAQDQALEHNRTLKNASLEIQKAEAVRWQTLATMLPQANVNLDYSNFMGYEINFGGMPIPMNPSGNLTAQVGIGLSGAQLIGTQLGAIATKMAEINLQKTEQDIVNQVKSLYYSILIMDQTVTLLDKSLGNIRKLHEFTENSVKVGVADQTDADQLLVQIATMETTINSTKRSLEMLYNSLRLQMGAEASVEITLTQTIEDLLNIEGALQLLKADFILDNNFNFQLVKQSADLSKKQIALNSWSYGPTVSAFYQYTKKTYFGKDEGFNMTPPNLVGAAIAIPIFSSGTRYTKVREAKLAHEVQLNTLADTKEALTIQHSQLCYNLKSAFESYDTQKKNIEVNQRILENISKKYEQGMASSLEVTTTGTNLITAQNSYVQALMEVVTAQIALEKLLNTDNQ
ncbi:MAG: TolC family protein [Bacteroidales bacterium]|nr:TolC family protein [Bacteroidales bacterium]MDD3892362.1 TolC family protein [Bacteroidales bacterium]